jgi:hypothetical protein
LDSSLCERHDVRDAGEEVFEGAVNKALSEGRARQGLLIGKK